VAAFGAAKDLLVLTCEYQLTARICSAALNVAVKADVAATLPVGCVVYIDPWAGTHRTVEDVLRGIDYDPGMPPPNHQVARLRMYHALKFVPPGVKVRRTRVAIRKARPKRLMPSVPLIMYSAFADKFLEQQARLIGIRALVAKSQDPAVLINKARTLLTPRAA